jgi:hypothetical protein
MTVAQGKCQVFVEMPTLPSTRRREMTPFWKSKARNDRNATAIILTISLSNPFPPDLIGTELPKRVKDKNQALLLHCASGMRSGMAKSKLKSMGYPNAFNLDSYGRAESILKQVR